MQVGTSRSVAEGDLNLSGRSACTAFFLVYMQEVPTPWLEPAAEWQRESVLQLWEELGRERPPSLPLYYGWLILSQVRCFAGRRFLLVCIPEKSSLLLQPSGV